MHHDKVMYNNILHVLYLDSLGKMMQNLGSQYLPADVGTVPT